ncbi:MAG: hypothetical protein LBB25_01175 [Holosporaceae bacterium]|jgi:hypothetical protein|nr:hypothetical protein [Holosporaceae bacterium]
MTILEKILYILIINISAFYPLNKEVRAQLSADFPNTLSSISHERSKYFRKGILLIKNEFNVNLENLESYEGLTRIVIDECDGVCISGILPTSLKEIRIEACTNVEIKSPFESLSSLELMDSSFKELSKLVLSSFLQLQNLKLHGCRNMILEGSLPATLRSLELLNNSFAPFPLDVSACTHLRTLSISDEVNSITFGKNSFLESLQITGCQNFCIIGHIPPSLKFLDLNQVHFSRPVYVDLSAIKNVFIEDCLNFVAIGAEARV